MKIFSLHSDIMKDYNFSIYYLRYAQEVAADLHDKKKGKSKKKPTPKKENPNQGNLF